MTTLSEFFTKVLTEGNFSTSGEAVKALLAGAKAESSQATWNPLDTEEPMDGATDFNSAGVKNYPDEATGVSAILRTLSLPRYEGLRAALRSGENARQIVQAFTDAGWTGGSDLWLQVLATDDLSAVGAELVAGSPPPPPPAPAEAIGTESAPTADSPKEEETDAVVSASEAQEGQIGADIDAGKVAAAREVLAKLEVHWQELKGLLA